MRQRFYPLELSAIMTFALLAILTLTTGLAWRERGRLIAENERMREWFAPLAELASAAEARTDS